MAQVHCKDCGVIYESADCPENHDWAVLIRQGNTIRSVDPLECPECESTANLSLVSLSSQEVDK